MDALVLTNVAEFGSLRDAKKIFDETHSYVKNRSAKIISRAIRNFAGLVSAVNFTLHQCDRQLENSKNVKFFWPRAFFCKYPTPFYKSWHRRPSTGWKRGIMLTYLDPEDLQREFTRLELFRLQKQMQTSEILSIGW